MDGALIFNSHLRALRRARAAQSDTSDKAAGFLFQEGAEALADRLSFIQRAFHRPVLHGNDFQALTQALAQALPHALPHIQTDTPLPHSSAPHLIEGECEIWPLEAESCDLILSNLQLHWVNDLPGLLVQIRRSLCPDGFFSACLIGGESLFELRASLAEAESRLNRPHRPRISPMIDVPTAAGLMQRAGFALPVVDHEIINLSYAHPLTLLKDLQAMGQSNAIQNQPTGIDPQAFWPTVCQAYQDLFPHVEGGVKATFDLIFLSGWAPASNQQQPLKPGSARMDLRQGLDRV